MAGASLAQHSPPPNLTYVRVTSLAFFPTDGSGVVTVGNGIARYPPSSCCLFAPLNVPGGAIIDYLELDAYDADPSNDILFYLEDCGPLGSSCTFVTEVLTSGSPGYAAFSVSGVGYTVTNAGGSLVLGTTFGALNPNLAITGVLVGYRLQVSPSPVTATFNDVPTSDFGFQYVEAFAAAGITAGCTSNPPFNPPVYCPDRSVTRREMAIFFAKALGLYFPN
jgi:hypothetical protein